MKIEKEIIRFLIVTSMAAITDIGLYFLLKSFLPSDISKGISFLCGGIVAYIFNKNWTFSKHRKSNPEMGRYWISGLVLLGYNVITNRTILNFWPHAVFLALAIASVSTAILSFIFKKWWVFKSA